MGGSRHAATSLRARSAGSLLHGEKSYQLFNGGIDGYEKVFGWTERGVTCLWWTRLPGLGLAGGNDLVPWYPFLNREETDKNHEDSSALACSAWRRSISVVAGTVNDVEVVLTQPASLA